MPKWDLLITAGGTHTKLEIHTPGSAGWAMATSY